MTEVIKYTEHVAGCCRNAAVQALEADNHYWQADAKRLAEALDHALTDYDLSYAGLSGMCAFEERHVVIAALEALRLHEEGNA